MACVTIVRSSSAQLPAWHQIWLPIELSFETGCRFEFCSRYQMQSQSIRGPVFQSKSKPDSKRKHLGFSKAIGLAPDLIMAEIFFLSGVGVFFKIPKRI